MPPAKRSRPSKKSNAPLLPFRSGFGTSCTALGSSSFGDGFGTNSTSTPLASSSSPDLVASVLSSTPSIVGDYVSPTQADTSEVWKRKWTAPVWKDYDVYDGDVFEDGEARAVCKFCKEGPIFASSVYGTSNFIRHNKICESNMRSGKGLPMKDAESAGGFNMSDYKEAVALCIIRHAYPFTFVEHAATRSLHRLLNPGFKSICRNTAKNYVMKIHTREKGRIRDLLHAVPGRICLTSDMWTSSMGQGYLSLTAHFIDAKWKLHAIILDFCHVGPPHTAMVLHDRILGLLRSWEIEEKVFSITLDNARCNDNMQAMLTRSLSLYNSLLCDGDYFHVRCSAHILNLVVQDGLLLIDAGVCKIRLMVKYVTGSERRILKFRETALYAGIDCSKKICLDCCTRWNSTYKMLHRALIYRNAFLRSMERADSGFPTLPTDEEWLRVEKMCELLEPFDHLTTLISGKNYPTANLYLHSIWRIKILLLKHSSSDDKFLSEMALRMKVKFDKYWENYSLLLSFAAMLDPRYKFQIIQHCFKELDAETFTSKTEHVKTQFRNLFDEYKTHVGPEVGGSMSEAEEHHGEEVEGLDFFDKLSDSSEIDAYLEAPRLRPKGIFNVLVWWKDNAGKYPLLAQMARDILATPITTVASESAFSMGSRVITRWRSSLDTDTADALMATRSWLYGFEVEDEDQEHDGLEFQISADQDNNKEKE